MKFSAVSASMALTAFAGLSVQAPTPTTTSADPATTTYTYHLQVYSSSNETQNTWYGFVDPKSTDGNDIAFQFTPTKSDATVFTVLEDATHGTLLQGYKDNWVMGSTPSKGSAAGGAVYQGPIGFFEMASDPFVNVVINARNAATSLTSTMADGTIRNISQTCYPQVPTNDKSLPVLVVGETLFEDCSKISLILTPAV